MSVNEGSGAYISNVGLNLRKISPSFDPRAFGFNSLTKMFEALSQYQIIKNEVNGLNHPLIKRKS